MPEESAGGAVKQLGHGAKEATVELLDVIFEWIVPVITLVVGYTMTATIGLSGALATIVDGALGSAGMSAAAMTYIADGLAALVWGGIGAGMWSVSKSYDGHYASYILRPLSTFFWGLGLGELGNALSGKVANGAIGKAATQLGA